MTTLQPIKRHGGKGAFHGKLARWIISLMPERDGSWNRYVEPYFGGGSVLMNLDPDGLSEYANDLDGELMNFWSILSDPLKFEMFHRKLSLTPLSKGVFSNAQKCYQQLQKLFANDVDDRIPGGIARTKRAIWFFIRNRQSRQALEKDYVAPTARIRRGMNEHVSAWLSAVDGLPEVAERLRRVEVWNMPALDCIRKLDSDKTVFYLDPCYHPSTRHAGGGEYGAYEMDDEDHKELLLLLTKTTGRFLLSGYHCDLYDKWASDCRLSVHEHRIANNASSKKRKEAKTEVVWCNY